MLLHAPLLEALAVVAAVRLIWWRIQRSRRNAFIASSAFLRTPEWRAVARQARAANDGRCEKCRRPFTRDNPANVDHIHNRRDYPGRALDIKNAQCLCATCNRVKANSRPRDYRRRGHPHRRP